MTTHVLKIQTQYFNDIILGIKRFEVRKNDRNYQIGDYLELHELAKEQPFAHMGSQRSEINSYTGRVITVKVLYILKDFSGLVKNYVVMTIARIKTIESIINLNTIQ